MSIAQWFEFFCIQIRMPEKTILTISNRYKLITKRLNIEYWGTDSDSNNSFYVGSYGRDTEISASDIDMLFILPYSVYDKYSKYQTNGQSALLQAVKEAIKITYPNTDLKGDGQIIQVKFADGINFEVLPAFINKDDKTYTHPDSNEGGKWKPTDPKSEIDSINERNKKCNGNLKLLCKMMRAWKDTMSVPIKGILIDALAYQFIENWKYKDKSYLYYDFMSRDFFQFVKDQEEKKVFWRAPGSGRLINNSDDFRYKAKRAYNISIEAIDDYTNEHYPTAKSKWREIFGTKFPS